MSLVSKSRREVVQFSYFYSKYFQIIRHELKSLSLELPEKETSTDILTFHKVYYAELIKRAATSLH